MLLTSNGNISQCCPGWISTLILLPLELVNSLAEVSSRQKFMDSTLAESTAESAKFRD